MSTQKTQNLIIRTAIDLFNKHGTKAISSNRIANECQISSGNLYYHFRTKEEIIQSIFQRISREMADSWSGDHLHPTMEYMYFIFTRQIKLIWGYRFFYLELNSLLQKDGRLKLLFMDNRKRRANELMLFFEAMVKAGFINSPQPPISLGSVVQSTWLVSDQWVPHLEMYDQIVDEVSIGKGYRIILQILQPYFTEKAIKEQQELLNKYSQAGAGLFGEETKGHKANFPEGVEEKGAMKIVD